jgi:hypothetical protein
MEFPFSIFIWQAPYKPTDQKRWSEAPQADYQQMAIYAANLLYQAGVPSQDTVRTNPVIKVVRFGLTIQAWPDAHTVELCEKQIARWNEHPCVPPLPPWARDRE